MGGIGILMGPGYEIVSHVNGKDWIMMGIPSKTYSIKGTYKTGKKKQVEERTYTVQAHTVKGGRENALSLARDDGLVRLIKCGFVKR